MTSSELVALLRKRYATDKGWIVVTEVGNGTGSMCRRHADAVALQTWPGRGIELDGFEIKVSRGDLVRELQDPDKAEAVARYCSRWWLVLGDEKLADSVALPPAWGVLAPRRGVLCVVHKPTPREPIEWPRTFVAALLRRAHEDRPSAEEAEQERRADQAACEERWRKIADDRARHEAEARDKAEAIVAAFDRGARQILLRYSDEVRAMEIGRVAALAMDGEGRATMGLARMAERLEESARLLRESLAERAALADELAKAAQAPA